MLGIGAATARRLAEEVADFAVVDLDGQSAEDSNAHPADHAATSASADTERPRAGPKTKVPSTVSSAR
jgi:NAD(P)-dependent dehydrogenase (short-subunit alcohol dehydrogenase family)